MKMIKSSVKNAEEISQQNSITFAKTMIPNSAWSVTSQNPGPNSEKKSLIN